MKSNKEIRSIPTGRLEIRKTADGKRTLVGVAAPFNSLSQDLGGFRERVQPGAFSSNLMSKPDVRLVADHDLSVSKLLARTASGTMRLREDSNAGLILEADLPNTTFADDVVESINRGDLSGLSMSFNANDDDWQNTSDGVIRTLRAVTLGPDISLVVTPAYQASTVSLRSCPRELRSLLGDLSDLILGDDDDSDDDDGDDIDPITGKKKKKKSDDDESESDSDTDIDPDYDSRALAVILARRRIIY